MPARNQSDRGESFQASPTPVLIFGDFTFDYDVDRIDALSGEREKDWARLGAASFLTDDEKREAVGYGRMPRGRKDDFAAADVGNAELGDGSSAGQGGGAWQNQPRVPAGNEAGGQWTAGGGGGSTFVPVSQAEVDASLVTAYDSSAPGWHDYEEGPNVICPAAQACSREEIADQMSRFAVPGQDPSQPVESGSIIAVFDPRYPSLISAGEVRTTISEDGLTITNKTEPGHIFHDGEIDRIATQSHDGSWYITTHGFGNNLLPGFNVINEWQGPQIFRYIDQLLRSNIGRHHGAKRI